MEEHTRKIAALFLSIVIFGQMCLLQVAATDKISDSASSLPKTVFIVEGQDGLWHRNSTETRSVGYQVTLSDIFENIYEGEDKRYFSTNDADVFVPVEKISVPLCNGNYSVEELKHILPEKIYEDIVTASIAATENNIMDAKAEFFVRNQGTRAAGDGIVMDETRTTYNGCTFIHQQIYFAPWYAGGTIAKGASVTYPFVKSLATLVVGYAGSKFERIGEIIELFDYGASLYDNFKSAVGQEPILGKEAKDQVDVDIEYNILLKYTTYVEPIRETKYLSCVTQKVRVTHIWTRSYLLATGGMERNEEEVICDELYMSPNFERPEPIAQEFAPSLWQEVVSYKFDNTTPVKFTWGTFPDGFPNSDT